MSRVRRGSRITGVLAGLAMMLAAAPLGAAEQSVKVTLKSGDVAEGKMVRNDSDFIVLDRNGVMLIYMVDNIERLTGAKLRRLPGAKAGSGSAGATAAQSPRRSLPFKSAVVTYRLSGDLEGSETIYIDGNRIAVEQFITAEAGRPSQRSTLLLDDGRSLIQADLDAKTATRASLGGGEGIIGYFEGEMSEPAAYTITDGEFLSLPCRIYQVKAEAGSAYSNYRTHTLYFHRRLLLRRETDFSYENEERGFSVHETKEAMDVQFDIQIPDRKFQLPEDVALP